MDEFRLDFLGDVLGRVSGRVRDVRVRHPRIARSAGRRVCDPDVAVLCLSVLQLVTITALTWSGPLLQHLNKYHTTLGLIFVCAVNILSWSVRKQADLKLKCPIVLTSQHRVVQCY